jgi:hypothetical protein
MARGRVLLLSETDVSGVTGCAPEKLPNLAAGSRRDAREPVTGRGALNPSLPLRRTARG